MKTSFRPFHQRLALLLVLAALASPLLAQSPPTIAQRPNTQANEAAQKAQLDATTSNAPLTNSGTQLIQRIRIEDEGSRIDELRYGGVIERIVVQPKFDVPAYEILPNDKVTSRPRGRDGAPPTHPQRVWNVLGF